MSYTNGGQTIDKSMNGIITFDTGGGVVIEGDTITSPNMTVVDFNTTNVTCNNLTVNTNATINGTSTFNNSLPTSTLTGTPTLTQIAPVSMLNNLYPPAVTGGYARLTTVNNAFTNNNAFNTALPTSTLTGTPTSTQIAPVSMLNNLYQAIVTGGFARLTTVPNSFTNNNSFNSFLPTSTLTGTPTSTQIAPVSMLNNIYARLSGAANTFTNYNIFAGGLSASNILTTYISWAAVSGNAAEQTFDTSTGIMEFLSYPQGTTSSFVFAFIPLLEIIVFKIEQTISTFFTRVQVTTPDTVNTNTTALSISNSNTTPATLNVILASLATSAINPMININETVIYATGSTDLVLTVPSSVQAGIRINPTFVGIQGTDLNVNTTSTANFNSAATNINSSNLVVSASTATTFVNLPSTTTTFTGATANQFITKNIGDTLYLAPVTGGYARLTTTANAFTNANSFTALPTTTTTFTGATANQFITKNIGDTSYLAPVTGGYARLTTTDNSFTNNNTFGGTNTIISSTATAINSPLTVTGSTSINGTFSGTLPMLTTYTTNPTLTENHIGFSIRRGIYTANGLTANTVYNLQTVSFPSLGVWIVNAQIFVNTAVANSYYRLSLSVVSVTHDYTNLVTGYSNYTSETDDIGVATMIVDSYTPSSALYIVASSNRNQFTDAVPPYLKTYNINYTITKVG